MNGFPFYLITPSLARKLHFWQYSAYFPCHTNWMSKSSKQIVVTMPYTECICRQNKHENSRIWVVSLLNVFLWVSQSLMFSNIRQMNCVIVLCVLFLCLMVRNVVCTCMYTCTCTAPIRAGMRDTCMNHNVEFTVLKIVFMKFWSYLKSCL